MTFTEAKIAAAKIGAEVPTYAADAPVAQCWIDRIQWADRHGINDYLLGKAITEANRYAGA